MSIVLFASSARRTKMGRIKTPKVIAPVEELENPEEVQFVLRVNTSLIRAISHVSLF